MFLEMSVRRNGMTRDGGFVRIEGQVCIFDKGTLDRPEKSKGRSAPLCSYSRRTRYETEIRLCNV
jgi:hypothetical protein